MQHTTETGSSANPFAEIRLDPEHIVHDIWDVVNVLIPAPKTGADKYWKDEGAAWLRAVALHVITRTERTEQRLATLADISAFLCTVPSNSSAVDFVQEVLAAMQDFDHGNPAVNRIVRKAVAHMQGKAPYERAGVFGAATAGLFH